MEKICSCMSIYESFYQPHTGNCQEAPPKKYKAYYDAPEIFLACQFIPQGVFQLTDEIKRISLIQKLGRNGVELQSCECF